MKIFNKKTYISKSVAKPVVLELKDKYKEFIELWKNYGGMLQWHKEFNGKFRIRIPLLSDNEIESEVIKELHKQGLVILDYNKNICIDPDYYKNRKIQGWETKEPRKYSIGSRISKNKELLHLFNHDPVRQAPPKIKGLDDINISDYCVVISRHPIDVASMSTGRIWRSCMTIKHTSVYTFDEVIKENLHDEHGNPITTIEQFSKEGINTHILPNDIKYGTIVAYVVRKNDNKIENPISRILMKPYYSLSTEQSMIEETVLVKENKKYGAQIRGFSETVDAWVKDAFDYKAAVYNLTTDLYQDSSPAKASVFTLLKPREYNTWLKNVGYKILPSKHTDENNIIVAYRERGDTVIPKLDFILLRKDNKKVGDFDPYPVTLIFGKNIDGKYEISDEATRSLEEEQAANVKYSRNYDAFDNFFESETNLRVYDAIGTNITLDTTDLEEVSNYIASALEANFSGDSLNKFKTCVPLLPATLQYSIAHDNTEALKRTTNLTNATALININPNLLKDEVYAQHILNLVEKDMLKTSSLNTSNLFFTKIILKARKYVIGLQRQLWAKGLDSSPLTKIEKMDDIILYAKAKYDPVRLKSSYTRILDPLRNLDQWILYNKELTPLRVIAELIRNNVEVNFAGMNEALSDSLVHNNISTQDQEQDFITVLNVLSSKYFHGDPGLALDLHAKYLESLSGLYTKVLSNKTVQIDFSSKVLSTLNGALAHTIFNPRNKVSEGKVYETDTIYSADGTRHLTYKRINDSISNFFWHIDDNADTGIRKAESDTEISSIKDGVLYTIEDVIPQILNNLADMCVKLIHSNFASFYKQNDSKLKQIRIIDVGDMLDISLQKIDNLIALIERAIDGMVEKGLLYKQEIDFDKIIAKCSPVAKILADSIATGHATGSTCIIDALIRNKIYLGTVDLVLTTLCVQLMLLGQRTASDSKNLPPISSTQVHKEIVKSFSTGIINDKLSVSSARYIKAHFFNISKALCSLVLKNKNKDKTVEYLISNKIGIRVNIGEINYEDILARFNLYGETIKINSPMPVKILNYDTITNNLLVPIIGELNADSLGNYKWVVSDMKIPLALNTETENGIIKLVS